MVLKYKGKKEHWISSQELESHEEPGEIIVCATDCLLKLDQAFWSIELSRVLTGGQ